MRRIEAIVETAHETGSASGEVRLRPDGAVLVVRARRSPVSGLWLVLEDVSELRRLQQIRAEFIDNLSHELRTPLTTVSLLAETLTREADAAGDAIPAKMRDRIAKIEVETGHLVQMVNELLDLSRIESGGGPILARRRRHGPHRRRRRRAAAPVRRPPGRDAQSWTCPRPCRRSAATRRDSARSLVNLLHNAVKFSPDGGDVTSRVAGDGGEVVTSVADHGVGIPKAAQARIFERFYKVDRARVRGEAGGTGLGLAIARHVIEQHGGRIWVESEEGRAVDVLLRPADRRRRRDRARTRKETDGPPARRHAQHPQPRRPLGGAAAADPRGHGGAPARPARRSRRSSTSDAAGPAHRRGGGGPLRGASGAGPAGRSTATACSSRSRSPRRDVERLDLGLVARRIAALVVLPGGATVLVVVTHLHHAVDAAAERDAQAAALLDWLDGAPTTDATIAMGDFNADPDEPTYARMRGAGFRSAYAEANGAEPAVTWPSGLQAPAMDTDGDPGCLDYIWVRGAVRVVDARLAFDRPRSGRPDALPERPLRHQRAPRDRLTWRRWRCRARTLRLAHRGDWRHAPGEHARGVAGGAGGPGLRRPRVRRPRLVRRRPGPAPRRDAGTRPGPARAGSTS